MSDFPGDFSGEATPVPIPNTAVKLSSADDTDYGKVGHRRVLFCPANFSWQGFLFLPFLPCLVAYRLRVWAIGRRWAMAVLWIISGHIAVAAIVVGHGRVD